MRLSIVTRPAAGRRASLLLGGVLALLNVPTATGQSPLMYDPLDPVNYVCVSEQTMQGNNYALFGNPDTCRDITSKGNDVDGLRWSAPSAEIDKGSRILIRFTRRRLVNLSAVAGAIGITGTISKGGNPGATPPIEILGYSEIGREARPASVRIRSVADISAGLKETVEIAARIEELIAVTMNDAALKTDAFTAESKRRDSILRGSVGSLTTRIELLQSRVDSLRSQFPATADSTQQEAARSLARTVTLDQTIGMISALAKARTDSLQEMSRLPKVAAMQRDFEQQANKTIREAIAQESAVLTTILTMISAPADTVAMDRMVARLGGHGSLLRAEAAVALTALKVIQDGATPDAKAVTAVEQVRRLLNKVGRLYSAHAGVADSIRADMILDIRDAMIDLGASGAEPGDHITLTITYTDDSRVSRALRIRLQVRQFGLVQHTSPSILFLDRRGIVPAPYPPADPVAGQTPDSYHFRATPGFTFGWSLQTRRQWSAPWLSTLVRWLDPGIGINVSFPRFSTARVRLEEETIEGEVTTRTVKETDNGPDLQIGTGPVLSFFGGAVQLTMGYNLMADRNRRYFGLGFAFIDLVGKIKDGGK